MPPDRQTQERNASTTPPKRQDAAATALAVAIDRGDPVLSQSFIAPAESSRQRWQFSIRGMLIFTLSVAIGASVSQIDISHWLTIFAVEKTDFRQHVEVIKTGWGGGMLAVLIFWLCLGLLYQIRDLWVFLKTTPAIDKERKAGGQIEIFWRAGLVALLAAYALVLFLINMRVLILPESGDHVWKMGTMLREAVLLLLLLVLIGSVPAQRKIKLPAICQQLINGVFYGLVIYYISKTFTHFLVNMATVSIDDASSLKFSTCDPRIFARSLTIFSWWSVISALVVLVNFFFLMRLARQWSAGVGRRLLWSGLLMLGIAENAAYVIWTMTIGYPTISPYLAQTGGSVMGHSWISLVILITILAAVSAYRMSTDRTPVTKTPEIAWRRNPNKYYHERWPILLLFAFAILWIMVDIYLEARRNPSFHLTEWGFNFFTIRSYWASADIIFFTLMPTLFLWLSLFLLTLNRAFSRRFDPQQLLAELPCINRAKFITIWLAMLAFTVFGALAVVWMSFGLWFNPWFNSR